MHCYSLHDIIKQGQPLKVILPLSSVWNTPKSKIMRTYFGPTNTLQYVTSLWVNNRKDAKINKTIPPRHWKCEKHVHQWALQFDSVYCIYLWDVLSFLLFFLVSKKDLMLFWLRARHGRYPLLESKSLSLLIPKSLAYIFGYMLWRQWLHSIRLTKIKSSIFCYLSNFKI